MFRCCDCFEKKVSEAALASHIASDHLLWMPYQCAYCLLTNPSVCTRKPTEHDLRAHVEESHPGQEFTMMHTPDENNKVLLAMKIERSVSLVNSQSPDQSNCEVPKPPSSSANDSFCSLGPSGVPEIFPELFPPDIKREQITFFSPVETESPQITPAIRMHDRDFNCTFYCLACEKNLRADVNRHLASVHIKEKVVCCSHCDYGTTWAVFTVSDHIKATHGGEARVVDKRDTIKGELNRQRRLLIVKKPADVLADIVANSVLAASEPYEQQDYEKLDPPKLEVRKRKRPADKRNFHCKQCKKDVLESNIYQHLSIHHLKKNRIYTCSMCDYGYWRKIDVKYHIERKHMGLGEAISRADEVKADLKQLKAILMVRV